jgi:Flp pilus assembly pilin Flp
MIETLSRTITTAATKVAVVISTFVAQLAAPAPTPALARTRSRRAATFVEYALLAAVALVIFVVFRTQLSSMFSSLMDRLRTALQ